MKGTAKEVLAVDSCAQCSEGDLCREPSGLGRTRGGELDGY